MADFGAKEVQGLRQATGAGMMDAKRALTESDGDFEAARRLLQEQGLSNKDKRSDRESTQGAVALGTARGGRMVALVQLRSETDFVAKSTDFVKLAQSIADAVATEGEAASEQFAPAVDELKVTLKENLQLGRVVRLEAGDGEVLDGYLHVQSDRGINGVAVQLAGGTPELAHEVALHISFARPGFLSRDEVPEAAVVEQRALLEAQTRNEGKPEQALPKIIEGKLGGWFKRVPGGALLEQPFARDDKVTVGTLLGDARVVRFEQVEIGA
ncbi:MAG: translation elongation factor Ts [Acidimicrobiia bacterium]|nr:translation elongation factor Ts [Acidimicrobiia bacterium]